MLVGQVTTYGSTSFSIDTASRVDLVSQFSAFEHGYTDASHELTITAVDLVSATDIRLTLATSATGRVDVWYRADYGTPGNPNAAIRDDVDDYGIPYGHQLQTRLTPVTVDDSGATSTPILPLNPGTLPQAPQSVTGPSTTTTSVAQVSTPVALPSSLPVSTTPPVVPAIPSGVNAPTTNLQVSASSPQVSSPSSLQQVGIYRFFDAASGVHIFTSSPSEFASGNPTFVQEANDFSSLSNAALKTDAAAAEVYRLFDTSTGGHFYTSSAAELNGLTNPSSSTYRSDLVFEPSSGFVEHTSEQTGDVAVYRFFDMTSGGHFFTSSQSEYAAISNPAAATYRADLHPEGVAFYAPAVS